MKLGNFKKLWDKDFDPENQDLVNKLALTINSGFENLYQALSKRLTFADNIQSDVKSIDVQVDATGKPINKVTFKLGTDFSINGCIIIQAINNTLPTAYVYSAPFISWTQKQTGIQIDNITGLIPSHKYTLKILVI